MIETSRPLAVDPFTVDAVPSPLPTTWRRPSAPVTLVPPTEPTPDAPTPDTQSPEDPLGAQTRWSLFRYSMRGIRRSAPRTAVWRELQAMGAVALRNREWAIPHQPRAARRLDRLVDLVHEAGGQATITEIGTDTQEDVQWRSRASRACEHLWDDLLNATDWFERQRGSEPLESPPEPGAVDRFDELRAGYAEARRRDFAASTAGRHAADRLHRLAPVGAVEPTEPSVGRRRRPRVELDAAWSCLDGRSMIVTRLYPRPSLAWEQEFHSFEQWAYRPSPDRLVLEHGLLCGPVETDQLRPVVQAVTDRIAAFEASRP